MNRYVLAFLLAVCTVAHAAPAPTLGAAAQGAAAQPPERADASLVLFNREVFVFRGALSGYSSADRARRARTRLQERLELGGASQVRLVPDTLGLMLQVDGASVFLITPADVDSSQGDTLEALGERTQQSLALVLAESRESRDLDTMLRALPGLATALLIFCLARWFNRALATAFERVHARRPEPA
jgi:hypothetical protein